MAVRGGGAWAAAGGAGGMITSRVVSVGVEYAVEFETDHLDLRYGPYPTEYDAEAVRLRITTALESESCDREPASTGQAPLPGLVS